MEKILKNNYDDILKQIITEIKAARVNAARRVNVTMIQAYWNIGHKLSKEKIEKGYGGNVVERLSVDIKSEFSNLKGFSPRNLWNMKLFYEFYSAADEKLQRKVAVLPWRHNILILTKIKDLSEAKFYIESALEMGWTRDVLLNFINADAYRNAKNPKLHNFNKVLPEHLQDQADEILKSSYNLSFLGIERPVKELELEKRILEKIKLFILELGKGFSFMGNQYRISSRQKDYFIDLLFFNRNLKSLIAIDLKIGNFKPEYAGKMNFYLGILDDKVKIKGENPSIGIILCADKDKVDVEIALRDINKPIGVADYKLYLPEKKLKELISKELKR
ncbi:MAG: PDDEXK nuclease domain-containing protein [Endomicrobia bacterium]|nr:PDDEXK nuclease domain-containing protein [Endomicrobiia bacterium]